MHREAVPVVRHRRFVYFIRPRFTLFPSTVNRFPIGVRGLSKSGHVGRSKRNERVCASWSDARDGYPLSRIESPAFYLPCVKKRPRADTEWKLEDGPYLQRTFLEEKRAYKRASLTTGGRLLQFTFV